MQFACGDEAIAAIVAFAADGADGVKVKVLVCELSYSGSGVFHQGKRRHAVFFCGSAVNGAHLFSRNNLHTLKKIVSTIHGAAVLANTQVKLELTSLHTAMLAAIAEINEHADDQPYDQTEPRNRGQVVHPPERKQDAQNWNQRNQRRFKWARQIRIATPQHPDTCGNNGK